MKDNYPPGARYDPNAPYNQEDAPEVEVLVRTVMTKATTVVETGGHYAVEHEIEPDGSVSSHGYWDYNFSPLEAYRDQQRTLRQTLGACVKVFDQLKKQGIHRVGKYSLSDLRDECEGWDDDELEVTEC